MNLGVLSRLSLHRCHLPCAPFPPRWSREDSTVAPLAPRYYEITLTAIGRRIPPRFVACRPAVPSREHLRLRSVRHASVRRPRALADGTVRPSVPAASPAVLYDGDRSRPSRVRRETHPHAYHALRPRRGRRLHGL